MSCLSRLEPPPVMNVQPSPTIYSPRAPRRAWGVVLAFLLFTLSLPAQLTNVATAALPLTPVPAPELGLSIVRVFGALFLVLAIFIGGVWLFRNWQRLAARRNGAPKLNVLEVRSLGGRQALYVVGYERERFLLSTSPNGLSLVTHLPTAEESTNLAGEVPQATVAFSQVLTQMLRGGR